MHLYIEREPTYRVIDPLASGTAADMVHMFARAGLGRGRRVTDRRRAGDRVVRARDVHGVELPRRWLERHNQDVVSSRTSDDA